MLNLKNILKFINPGAAVGESLAGAFGGKPAIPDVTTPKPMKLYYTPEEQKKILNDLFARLGQQMALGQNQVSDAAAAANLPAESRLAALRGYNQKFQQAATNAAKNAYLGLNQQQLAALQYLMGLRQRQDMFNKELQQRQWDSLFNLFNRGGEAAAMLL